MKKFAAILLCLITVISLFGCGRSSKKVILSESFDKISVDAPKEDEDLKKQEFSENDGSKVVNYFVGDDSSKIDHIDNFDNQGNIESKQVFTYDEDGTLIAARTFDKDNKLSSATAYEYDEDTGKRKRICYYNEDGSLKYYELDIYDENGYLIQAPIIDAEGNTLASGERTTAATTVKEEKKEKSEKKTDKKDSSKKETETKSKVKATEKSN